MSACLRGKLTKQRRLGAREQLLQIRQTTERIAQLAVGVVLLAAWELGGRAGWFEGGPRPGDRGLGREEAGGRADGFDAADGFFSFSSPGFTGDADWHPETFDLSAYAGKTVLLAFRNMTDTNTLGNGGAALDYMEVIGRGRKITKPAIPWLAVPTTAGTDLPVTDRIWGRHAHGFLGDLDLTGIYPWAWAAGGLNSTAEDSATFATSWPVAMNIAVMPLGEWQPLLLAPERKAPRKRTPELMQRVEALVNHPQSNPDQETQDAPRAAVINEALARRFAAGQLQLPLAQDELDGVDGVDPAAGGTDRSDRAGRPALRRVGPGAAPRRGFCPRDGRGRAGPARGLLAGGAPRPARASGGGEPPEALGGVLSTGGEGEGHSVAPVPGGERAAACRSQANGIDGCSERARQPPRLRRLYADRDSACQALRGAAFPDHSGSGFVQAI